MVYRYCNQAFNGKIGNYVESLGKGFSFCNFCTYPYIDTKNYEYLEYEIREPVQYLY